MRYNFTLGCKIYPRKVGENDIPQRQLNTIRIKSSACKWGLHSLCPHLDAPGQKCVNTSGALLVKTNFVEINVTGEDFIVIRLLE